MKSQDMIKQDKEHILATYSRYPITLEKGKGAFVYSPEGKEYLDFLSGISVCNFGHCNETINKAIKDQLDTLIHTSNLYFTEFQGELGKCISDISFPGKTFFTNSGTEANEAALKLCRFRGNQIAQNKNVILSLQGSFHGRSSGSLALTGQKKHQEGFEPLLPNIVNIKFNDIEDLRKNFNENTAAIFIEPIQGESGIHPIDIDYIKEVRKLCDEYDALLIFDEIQTGLGRTGKYLAAEHFGIEADGFTLAKSLANGLPIGAFHIKDKHAEYLPAGKHATTFGGNPLVCRAGLEVMKILTSGLLDNVNKQSDAIFKLLNKLKEKYTFIKEVRGKGLMIALELSVNAQKVLKLCHEEGLLVNAIGESVIRLLPPLTITEAEVELFEKKMGNIFAQC